MVMGLCSFYLNITDVLRVNEWHEHEADSGKSCLAGE